MQNSSQVHSFLRAGVAYDKVEKWFIATGRVRLHFCRLLGLHTVSSFWKPRSHAHVIHALVDKAGDEVTHTEVLLQMKLTFERLSGR